VHCLYLIKAAATYIGETLGNVSGGLKQGSVYEGATKSRRRRDSQKLMGLEQLTFHANVFRITRSSLKKALQAQCSVNISKQNGLLSW
jgi:porin